MVLLDAASPAEYLGADEIVESRHPDVVRQAAELRARHGQDEEFAAAAFEWVRDAVAHSGDAHDPRVTLTASEVLRERVGLCYAKSHLLAAILRAEGIPTGLCYQLLADGEGHVLHGLVAVHLHGRWHRQDPRGNKPGITAEFSLEEERLAFEVDTAAGEIDFPRVHVSPARSVVRALRAADDMTVLYERGLPSSLDG